MNRNGVRSFRDLIVWQKAMDLVIVTYHLNFTAPKHEIWGICFQIKKSALSVPSNIAEGYGRNGLKEYIRFLNIGLGSLFEYQTQILLASKLEIITDEETKRCVNQSREIEIMLVTLIRRLKQKLKA